MPIRKTHAPEKHHRRPHPVARLSDEALLDLVQRQTIGFFWDGAHPVSGLALDRVPLSAAQADDRVGIGGAGFGFMAIVVAVERGWINREEALERLTAMLGWLEKAACYDGLFSHYINGGTGATMSFGRKDDGGDLVESAYLFQGLLCARPLL
jgi:hypothetical protein